LQKDNGEVILFQYWVIGLNCNIERKKKAWVNNPAFNIDSLQRRIDKLKANQQNKVLGDT
jgi:hypothetical protein